MAKKPGRRTHDDANNLLDALLARAKHVLAFLDDLTMPQGRRLAASFVALFRR
jgi:hypothetical protein